MQAVDRQVSDEAAKPHLQSLSFANANAECKRIISAMPGQPIMTEMIEACTKVGTPQHIAPIQAGVWGEQVGKLLQAQDERLSRTPAALHPIFQQGNSTENAVAPSRCPRCRKGEHYANQCYSKYDMEIFYCEKYFPVRETTV